MNIVIQIDNDKKNLIKNVKEYLINDIKINSFSEKIEKSSLYNNAFETLYNLEIWNIFIDDISEEDTDKIETVFGKTIKILKEDKSGINEGVNVDYHTIMNNANFNYTEWYENLMRKKDELFVKNESLKIKLREKREYGIKKYGDKSFQASFEASMTSPIIEHAMEELIDEINYLFHLHFKLMTNGYDNSSIENLIKNVIEVYNKLEKML